MAKSAVNDLLNEAEVANFLCLRSQRAAKRAKEKVVLWKNCWVLIWFGRVLWNFGWVLVVLVRFWFGFVGVWKVVDA